MPSQKGKPPATPVPFRKHDTFNTNCWCQPKLEKNGLLVHNKKAPKER